jgi:chaperonin GroEL
VKAPGFGDRRKEMLQDIAIVTGGTVISEETGLTLEKMTAEQLGKRETRRGRQGQHHDHRRRGPIRADRRPDPPAQKRVDDTTSDYDKEKLQERIAKLSGGVAVVKVGAATEIEMKEKKDRVDDAMNATRAAVEEGVVPGGGVALVRVQQRLRDSGVRGATSIRTPVSESCCARSSSRCGRSSRMPARTHPTCSARSERARPAFGYNAQTEQFGDMVEMGIVDPRRSCAWHCRTPRRSPA